MNSQQLSIRVAAVLTTLLETGGSPESMIYLSFGSDIEGFNIVNGFLLENKFIESRNHYITLTPKGKTLAQKINERLKA